MGLIGKKQFVNEFRKRTEWHKEDAKIVYDVFWEIIVDELLEGNTVLFRGYGTFDTYTRKAGMVKDPNTGEPKPVGELTIPTFRFGEVFKDTIKKGKCHD